LPDFSLYNLGNFRGYLPDELVLAVIAMESEKFQTILRSLKSNESDPLEKKLSQLSAVLSAYFMTQDGNLMILAHEIGGVSENIFAAIKNSFDTWQSELEILIKRRTQCAKKKSQNLPRQLHYKNIWRRTTFKSL
jgi:hypothetical protein